MSYLHRPLVGTNASGGVLPVGGPSSSASTAGPASGGQAGPGQAQGQLPPSSSSANNPALAASIVAGHMQATSNHPIQGGPPPPPSAAALQAQQHHAQHQQPPTGPPGPPLPPPGLGPANRLADLLEFVKVETDAIASQNEALRRDNLEYAAHAEIHLSELSLLRRELVELEREHSRAKAGYEDRISELKRQVESLKAQLGTGPPIPQLMPAQTNYFGSLMGHPHGMFPPGSSGPRDSQQPPFNQQLEGGGPPGAGANSNGVSGPRGGAPGPGPGPGQIEERERERERREYMDSQWDGFAMREREREQQQQRERERERERERDYPIAGAPPRGSLPGDREMRDARDPPRDARERSHFSGAVGAAGGPLGSEHLGKRGREAQEGYDGQPPALKTRMAGPGPMEGIRGENGVESRTASAANFPPRPASVSYAQSPHLQHPGRPQSGGGPIPPEQPHSQQQHINEPSVLSQPHTTETKPYVGKNPPYNSPMPPATPDDGHHHQQAQQHGLPPQPHAVSPLPQHAPKKAPITDWDVTYNSKTRKQLDVSLLHTFVHESVVCCVRISPDGKMLATGCNRSTTLYDTKTGNRIAQLQDESNGVLDNYIRSVAFSPDGKVVATGSEDKIVRVWDISKQSLKMVLTGHSSEIYSLAFTPDGKYIVSGSGDKTARIWDADSGAAVHVLVIDTSQDSHPVNGPPLDGGVTSIAISPDNKFLAAGSLDHTVRIWDLHTGKLLDRLKGHKDSVYSVVFIPGGKQILTGSLDKTLKIWDMTPLKAALAEGRESNTNEMRSICTNTLAGHKDYVLSVATSSDGNWVVSGSKDRAVQFWDVRNGQWQFILHGHKNSVISIATSETGGMLATGSGDWQARIFKINGLGDPIPAPALVSAPPSISIPTPVAAIPVPAVPSVTVPTPSPANNGASPSINGQISAPNNNSSHPPVSTSKSPAPPAAAPTTPSAGPVPSTSATVPAQSASNAAASSSAAPAAQSPPAPVKESAKAGSPPPVAEQAKPAKEAVKALPSDEEDQLVNKEENDEKTQNEQSEAAAAAPVAEPGTPPRPTETKAAEEAATDAPASAA